MASQKNAKTPVNIIIETIKQPIRKTGAVSSTKFAEDLKTGAINERRFIFLIGMEGNEGIIIGGHPGTSFPSIKTRTSVKSIINKKKNII
ncbi:MAG: hypothetical protein PHW03_04355 [Eubacteriales bacterium]|nr:hypothetical protein [Eubacteriales bacterium]